MDDKVLLCVVLPVLILAFWVVAFFMGRASSKLETQELKKRILSLQAERDWHNGKARGGDT